MKFTTIPCCIYSCNLSNNNMGLFCDTYTFLQFIIALPRAKCDDRSTIEYEMEIADTQYCTKVYG